MIPIPASRSSEISSNTSCRDCGSRPALGSSRNSTSGLPDQRGGKGQPLLLAAGEPPDCGPAEGVDAQPLDQLVDRPRVLVHAGDVPQQGNGTGRRRQPAVLQHHTDAGTQLGACGVRVLAQQGDRSRRCVVCSPWAHSMVVVLPAPLAPSRAVTCPRSATRETPLTTRSILPSRVASGPTSLMSPLMDRTGDSGDRTKAFYAM